MKNRYRRNSNKVSSRCRASQILDDYDYYGSKSGSGNNLGGGGHPYGIDGCANVVTTSPFGMRPDPMGGGMHMHWGIDLAWLGGGNPNLFPMWDGVVVNAGDGGAWGLMVWIRHENVEDRSGTIHPIIYTLYSHMNAISTSVGANVTPDDPIGTEGTTGNSTGDHLHLEITTNPSFFNGNGATVGTDIFDPDDFFDFTCAGQSTMIIHGGVMIIHGDKN